MGFYDNQQIDSNINLKPNNKHHRLFSLIKILLVLLTAIIITFLLIKNVPRNLRTKASFSGPTLSLIPANKEVTVGEIFPLEIIMDTNEKTVSAAELHLTYDSEAIEIVYFTVGSPLSVILTPEKHENGELIVVLGVQPTAPFQGSGIIASLGVKIIGNKQSSIAFSDKTVVTVVGQDTNALDTATGSLITITLNAAPTPTLASDPTITPTPYIISSLQIPTDPIPTQPQEDPTPKPTMSTITEPPQITDNLIPTDDMAAADFEEPSLILSPTPTTVVEPTPTVSENPSILQIISNLWKSFLELIF